MNAVISGSAGLAVIHDGRRFFCVDQSAEHRRELHPGEGIWHVFGESRDLEFLEETDEEAVRDRLKSAIREADALDITLTLLDPFKYHEDTLARAADELDDLLTSSVSAAIENVLYSCPIPTAIETSRVFAAVQSHPRVHALLASLVNMQPSIRVIHESWLSVPIEAFANPSDKELFGHCMVRRGIFRNGVLAHWQEKAVSEIATSAVALSLMERFANHQFVLTQWARACDRGTRHGETRLIATSAERSRQLGEGGILRVFLAHAFDESRPDPHGPSNLEIGRWFQQEIKRLGGNRVDVITDGTSVPSMMADAIKQQIESADAVICLFCRRTWDQIPQTWMPSSYVISESGYAASRFRNDAKRRVFGFREQGVDRKDLGLAFPDDWDVPEFNRRDLGAAVDYLERVVRSLLHQSPHLSEASEPLLFHSRIQVLRNRRAMVEDHFRFRVRRDTSRFRMRHSLWSARHALPSIRLMLDALPSQDTSYFRCLPIALGKIDAAESRPEIHDISTSPADKEIGFSVSFPNAPLKAGDLVEYQFAYSYDHAFLSRQDLETWEKNLTGLRTDGFGPVRQAILTLMFERKWDHGENVPAIDERPKIEIHNATYFPAHLDPRDFMHRSPDWTAGGLMDRIQALDFPMFEVYEWRSDNFRGFAKATWEPCFAYHDSDEVHSRESIGGARRTSRPASADDD